MKKLYFIIFLLVVANNALLAQVSGTPFFWQKAVANVPDLIALAPGDGYDNYQPMPPSMFAQGDGDPCTNDVIWSDTFIIAFRNGGTASTSGGISLTLSNSFADHMLTPGSPSPYVYTFDNSLTSVTPSAAPGAITVDNTNWTVTYNPDTSLTLDYIGPTLAPNELVRLGISIAIDTTVESFECQNFLLGCYPFIEELQYVYTIATGSGGENDGTNNTTIAGNNLISISCP